MYRASASMVAKIVLLGRLPLDYNLLRKSAKALDPSQPDHRGSQTLYSDLKSPALSCNWCIRAIIDFPRRL